MSELSSVGVQFDSPYRANVHRLKDHDVTWLYGPLQTGISKSFHADSAPPASQISRTNSFASKKPILKKRSLSEVMLQRSISSSTLMKQATDALQAQGPEKRMRDRPSLCSLGDGAVPTFVLSSNPTTPGVSDLTDASTALQSASSSGSRSPSDKRHIHFNDKVEQCIAINKDGDEAEEYFNVHDDDSSDDDGVIMMKPVPGKTKLSNRSTPRNSFSTDSKTIAMLPSTTLKYRSDTPELVERPSTQNGGFWNTASKIAQSPSQETLKPSKPSTNFLLDDEDEEDLSWQPSGARRDSIFVHQDRLGTSRGNGNEDESPGLRRTPSGMFMPYEEDEDDAVAAGLFGRVVDTVNTAKDIAHVIWNVGWRR
ncbi:MAG: hypothetical protein LQ347_005198 [Umbilicaria vellea]|nr:MAG: hypothetical protein LQ347_005198 [Umbilicaria vellea]